MTMAAESRPGQISLANDLGTDLSPRSELIEREREFEHIVYKTAAAVAWEMQHHDPIPADAKSDDPALMERKDLYDNISTDNMVAGLGLVRGSVIAVAGEGRKDQVRGHNIGVIRGSYGMGGKVIWIANDPLENTTFAAKGLDGATSIIAVTEEGGLMPEPEGFDYMDKLFAPNIERLSIDDPPKVTFAKVMEGRNIKNPKYLTVTILKRPRNAALIKEAIEFGVEPDLVDGGDLTPAIVATRRDSLPGRAHLVMGIGGVVEGIIAAVAAKEQGGFVQGRIWHPDPEVRRENSGFLTIDDLVPARKGSSFVTMAHVTNDSYLNQRGAVFYRTRGKYSAIVNVTTIDSQEIRHTPHI